MSADSKYPPSVKAGKPVLMQLSTGWKQETLDHYLELIPRKAKIQDELEYGLVTVKRSRGGVVRREHLLGRNISVKSQFFLEEDDFLISKRQIVHGACGFVPDELSGSIVSNEYSVFKAKPNFFLPYLKYLSETLYFQQTCFHSSIGVHIEKMIFKLESWFKWKFNIPPLPEQKKIAQIISTWDKAIETVENLIENSQQQKKALMQQLLTRKKRFLGFEKMWAEGKLSNFTGKIYGGGTPSRDIPEYWKGSIPWVSVKDLISTTIFGAQESITQLGLTESSASLVPKGTVIIATRMAIGKAVVATCDVAINQDLKAILDSDRINSQYLHYWFLNISNKIEKMGTGSTVKGVQVTDIKSLKMSVPSTLNEQKKIASILSTADKETKILTQQLIHLKQEKKALMQQLLTGKRRVKLNKAEQP
jgi:type I restriction enzyme, S subunit